VVHPKTSSIVMLATVVVTVFTANLALGVTVGVLLSGVFFTFKVAKLLSVRKDTDEAGERIAYHVTGQVFFASADAFIDAFDIADAEGMAVTIDLTHAHFWDITAVAALDRVVQRFKAHGVVVEVIGLNEASATLIGRLDNAPSLKEI